MPSLIIPGVRKVPPDLSFSPYLQLTVCSGYQQPLLEPIGLGLGVQYRM